MPQNRTRRLQGLQNLDTRTLERRFEYHNVRRNEVKEELVKRHGGANVMFPEIEEGSVSMGSYVEREIKPDKTYFEDSRPIEDDTTKIGEVHFDLTLNRPANLEIMEVVSDISHLMGELLVAVRKDIAKEVPKGAAAKEVRPKKK